MKHAMCIKNAGKKGFSLVEMLVAMMISSLIILTVVAAFASAFRARENAGNIQRNIEDAKTAMEYMAKVMRMSSNLKAESNLEGGFEKVSMYSKSLNKCIEFSFDSTKGVVKELKCDPVDTENPCSLGVVAEGSDCYSSPGESVEITNGNLKNVQFYLKKDEDQHKIRLVTIKMEIEQGGQSSNLQTSVSLRDYRKVNPVGK